MTSRLQSNISKDENSADKFVEVVTGTNTDGHGQVVGFIQPEHHQLATDLGRIQEGLAVAPIVLSNGKD